MKHPKRFTDAVTKLYTAFYNGTLDAMDCKACAVGNICDGSDRWHHYGGFWVGDQASNGMLFKHAKKVIEKTGYSAKELIQVERIFIREVGHSTNEETQIKGLFAVIEYLCELDNIPNVLDFQKVFEQKPETVNFQEL
jgi:hypothetical protein